MDHETLVTLTADIVSAHVSNNQVEPNAIQGLIATVYAALENAGSPAPAPQEAPKPAVSIKASVKPDAITCLECGFKGKMIKRHLGTEHGLTPVEYKARWGLATNYPLVAETYSQTRMALAKKIGLGRKPGQAAKRKKA
jgi:predicted transcriptional regulator